MFCISVQFCGSSYRSQTVGPSVLENPLPSIKNAPDCQRSSIPYSLFCGRTIGGVVLVVTNTVTPRLVPSLSPHSLRYDAIRRQRVRDVTGLYPAINRRSGDRKNKIAGSAETSSALLAGSSTPQHTRRSSVPRRRLSRAYGSTLPHAYHLATPLPFECSLLRRTGQLAVTTAPDSSHAVHIHDLLCL